MKNYKLFNQDFGAPPPPPPPNSYNQPSNNQGASGLAITTLVGGILTFIGFWCCWFGILGFIPVITGIIELNKIKSGSSSPAGKTLCMIGIILGSLGFIITIIFFILGMGLNLLNTFNNR